MSTGNRAIAVLSYLLGPIGWLYAITARRSDALVIYHARQSLLIDLVAIAAPIVWIAVGWLLAWIPWIGPVFAILLFGLVIAIELGMLVALINGVINAAQGEISMAPLIGSFAEKLPIVAAIPATVESNVEC